MLAWGEGLEGGMAVPVVERTMRVCVCSVLSGTFVLMSRWLEVEVFCVWGSVVSECKLSRKKHSKGGKRVGKVRGTKVQDLMKGLSDIIY